MGRLFLLLGALGGGVAVIAWARRAGASIRDPRAAATERRAAEVDITSGLGRLPRSGLGTVSVSGVRRRKR